jgi:hypothetical protein
MTGMQATLLELFTAAGFECEDMCIHERQVHNRAKELIMNRRWIQATFRYVKQPLTAKTGSDLYRCTMKQVSVLLPSRNKMLSVRVATGHVQWLCHAGAAGKGEGSAELGVTEEWSQTSVDTGLATDVLFGEAGQTEEVEEAVEVEGVGLLRLQSVSRLHRHTLAHTGLMLWDSAPTLCRFIKQHPSLFLGLPPLPQPWPRGPHAHQHPVDLPAPILRPVACSNFRGRLSGYQSSSMLCRQESARNWHWQQPLSGLCSTPALQDHGGI